VDAPSATGLFSIQLQWTHRKCFILRRGLGLTTAKKCCKPPGSLGKGRMWGLPVGPGKGKRKGLLHALN